MSTAQEDLTKRLPPELLTLIFQAWKDAWGVKRYGLDAGWVRAARVCKRWREVALEAVELWSSIPISWHTAADNPALEMQLDRARSVPLDLLILCARMSKDKLKEAFSLVLSRMRSVKKIQVVYDVDHQAAMKGFVEDVGLELVSLSLNDSSDTACEWEFTPDVFPRLRHLYLNNIVPTTSGIPLLTLVQLEIASAYDDMQLQAETPALEQEMSTRINRFLAACPNLENLKSEACFLYPTEYHLDNQPVVPLPKLRYLSLEDSVSDLAKILGLLRVQPSTSVRIIAHGEFNNGSDIATLMIPRTLGEALPAIRHTSRLSFMVGQPPPSHLSLCGSLGVDPMTAFENDKHRRQLPSDWSITIPDLTCFQSGELHYLGLNGQRFLTHIPHLVVPSLLIELQLHFAHGLPIARDWALFFPAMPHLRTLGVGGSALVTDVLKAFLVADAGLCEELQDLTLCAAKGRVTEEVRLLVFFREVVGRWIRRRARMGTRLRSLRVRLSADTLGLRAFAVDGDSVPSDGVGLPGQHGVEPPVWFASKLRRELVGLEDLVGKVIVEAADCPACGVEYELPLDLDQSTDDKDAEGSDGNSDGGYFY